MRLVYAPDATYRGSLLIGAVAAVALVLIAGLGVRGRPLSAEPRARRRRGRLRPWIVVAVALLTLGVVGAVVASAAYACVTRWGHRTAWALAGAVVAVAPALAAPWPTGTGWSATGLVASAILVAAGTAAVVAGAVRSGQRRCAQR